MEHHQVRSNSVPDGTYDAYRHDILSPLDIIRTPEFRPGNPLYGVQQRLARYLEMRTNTPPQRGIRHSRTSELSEANVEQQFQIHLDSSNGRLWHLRDPTYLQQQRFLFDANLVGITLLRASNHNAASASLLSTLYEQPPADPSFRAASPHDDDDDDSGYFMPTNPAPAGPPTHQDDNRGRLVLSGQPQQSTRMATRGTASSKRIIKARKSTPDVDGHKPSPQGTSSLPSATRPSHMDVDDSDTNSTSSYDECRG